MYYTILFLNNQILNKIKKIEYTSNDLKKYV